MPTPVPVHVVAGFLGAGKTTLLLDQLRRRQGREVSAVVVNDFGEARFDATLLGGAARVKDIAGGCICCTAPQDLAPALTALLAEVKPDRIFIEATGLGRPADIVDTLRRKMAGVEIAPVVVVIDPGRFDPTDALLAEQAEAADVWVLNPRPGAPAGPTEALRRAGAERFPPLLAVAVAESGAVDPGIFDLRAEVGLAPRGHDHHHHASTAGYAAVSGSWGAEVVFDAARLGAILVEGRAERVKGLFLTDLGWRRVEWAGGRLSTGPSANHGVSRVDVIVKGPEGEARALLETLDGARWAPPEDDGAELVRLVRADGSILALGRAGLAALDGQVGDVSTLVPGREGQAVPLAAVLALLAPPAGARFIMAASDGLTTDAVPVDAVGAALLVHSLRGEALPPSQGGPFRILIPPGEGQSACANVKKLARIVVTAP